MLAAIGGLQEVLLLVGVEVVHFQHVDEVVRRVNKGYVLVMALIHLFLICNPSQEVPQKQPGVIGLKTSAAAESVNYSTPVVLPSCKLNNS